MILLLGDSEDTILYFKTRLEAEPFETFPFGNTYKGVLGSEEVIIASTKESNYLSAMLTSAIIERTHPYMVISLGNVISFEEHLHQGDIFIADRYFAHGVDFSGDGKSVYGQIPGLPAFFNSDTAMNNRMQACIYDATNLYVRRGYLLSGDKNLLSQESFDEIKRAHFASNNSITAGDTNSFGIATACHLYQVNLLTVKAIGRQIGKPDQVLTQKRVSLEKMPLISKAISRLIIELERP